ncbi:MAG: hypothetical protein FJ189_07790 [Gammaproteobacteria bacterium]|nr:hypothetical protein [Gammaproteobacteria bacterium]
MKKAQRNARLEESARKKQKRERLASALAPQEELSAPPSLADSALLEQDPDLDAADEEYVDGSVILDGEHLDLPSQIIHVEGSRRETWMNPVLTVVVTIAICFTALIAYLISIEPD